jgi:hypothetical protein
MSALVLSDDPQQQTTPPPAPAQNPTPVVYPGEQPGQGLPDQATGDSGQATGAEPLPPVPPDEALPPEEVPPDEQSGTADAGATGPQSLEPPLP